MVLVKFIQENEFYRACSLIGHASKQTSKDYNLVCASISVLAQTLYFYLKEQNFIFSKEVIKSGYMDFSLEKVDEFSTDLAQNSFCMTITGLMRIKKKYPTEIQIIGVH